MKTRKKLIASLLGGIQQAEAKKEFDRELHEVMCELFACLDEFEYASALLKFIRDAQTAILAEEDYREILMSCIGIVQDELMTAHRETVFNIIKQTFIARNKLTHEIITHFIGSELMATVIEEEVFK